MSTLISPPAERLAGAGQQLREQLLHFEVSIQQAAVQPLHVGGLLEAFGSYEQAVLACLPPDPAELLNFTPEQLLAYRETQPLYRLGWIRGHQTGLALAQRNISPALNLYAQHAALPAPTDPTALMQQVRRFLAELHLRYGAGPITAVASRPAIETK